MSRIPQPLYHLMQTVRESVNDMDFICTVNHQLMPYIFACAGVSLLSREFHLNPISIWQKAEFQNVNSWITYASQLCYIEGTYFIPLNETLPNRADLYDNYKKLNYYQWAPYLLIAFAVLMYIPRFIWDMVNQMSALHMPHILQIGQKCKRGGVSYKAVKTGARHLKYALEQNRKITGVNIFADIWVKIFNTHFHAATFLFIKMVNIVCVFIVLALLSATIAEESVNYLGADVVYTIIQGVNWRESGIFPTVTICPFKIREYGEHTMESVDRSYAVQCSLQTNFMFVKLFVCLWFALVAIQICNLYSFVSWLIAFHVNERKKLITNLTHNALSFMLLPAEIAPEYKDRDIKTYKMNILTEMLANITTANKLDARTKAYAEMREMRKQKRESRRKLFQENMVKVMDEFIFFLGEDGFFVIHILYANYGSFAASHLASKMLWKYIKRTCIPIESPPASIESLPAPKKSIASPTENLSAMNEDVQALNESVATPVETLPNAV